MLSRLKAGWFAGRRDPAGRYWRHVIPYTRYALPVLGTYDMDYFLLGMLSSHLIARVQISAIFFSAVLFSSTRCNGPLSFIRLVAAPDSRSCPLLQLLRNESQITGCLACLAAGSRLIASQGQKFCKSALRLFYTKSREVFIFKAHFGTEGYDWLITERTHPYERS